MQRMRNMKAYYYIVINVERFIFSLERYSNCFLFSIGFDNREIQLKMKIAERRRQSSQRQFLGVLCILLHVTLKKCNAF